MLIFYLALQLVTACTFPGSEAACIQTLQSVITLQLSSNAMQDLHERLMA